MFSPSPAVCLLANIRGREETYISPYAAPWVAAYPRHYVSPYPELSTSISAPVFAPGIRRNRQIRHDVGIKLQALAIFEYITAKGLLNSVQKAFIFSEISVSKIYALKKQAGQRGFDFEIFIQLKIEYVKDVPRKGAPIKFTCEIKKNYY